MLLVPAMFTAVKIIIIIIIMTAIRFQINCNKPSVQPANCYSNQCRYNETVNEPNSRRRRHCNQEMDELPIMQIDKTQHG